MLKILTSLLFIFAMQANTAFADDALLLKFDYVTQANVPYETNFYRVPGAPLRVSYIAVKISGTYCNLVIDGLQYTSYEGGYAYVAQPVGLQAQYEIPGGVVSSINVRFHQTKWNGADCSLYVYNYGQRVD